MTEFAVKNAVFTWLIVALLVFAGVQSYGGLGKLEDPEFTIKTATVITQYPGASPEQVELEVTDVIEEAVQEIAELDYIESISHAGLSIVKVNIKSQYWADELPQIWDMLRRKIDNVKPNLPEGASQPDIGDDFGDVYGFVLAITGDGFTYQQLESEVKKLKTRLSLVDGVARVEYWGKLPRAIYITLSESRLANLGLTVQDIADSLDQQNLHTDAGNLYHKGTQTRIEVTGDLSAVRDIGELVVRGSALTEATSSATGDYQEVVKIRDIATVEEGFIELTPQRMRYNGEPAIGLAISNVSGSNIVQLGEDLDAKLQELIAQIPVGIELHKVAWQQEEVSKAIDSFIISLLQAIAIVLVVLAVAMGWRMGVIIGTALILTILGTLVFMKLFGLDLQRMSLGALVIALGMMVDNAIVVADGIVVRLQKGMDRTKAAIEAATKPSIPLLAATFIAVLAFYPIGGSPDSSGEYCLSLFQVVGISLLFSWLVSITVTPLQCLAMLNVSDEDANSDPYGSPLFKKYRSLLEKAIHHRVLTLASCVGLLALAAVGFTQIPQLFFPDSSRPQFMVDMYAVNGTRISQTSDYLKRAEEKVMQMEGVESVATFIGSGPPRFYLPVDSEMFYTSYGQLIVNVDNFKKIDGMAKELGPWLAEAFPEVPVFRIRKYGVGPSNTWPFEVRISAPSGTSKEDIRAVADQGLALISDHPWVRISQLNWREQVPKMVLDYDQDRGRFANISKTDVSRATARAFDGAVLGQYREGNELIPMLLRNNASERNNPASLYGVKVPQAYGGQSVPLPQVTTSIHAEWEDPYIWRRNRLRTIAIQASTVDGITLPTLRADVLEKFNEYEELLPPGWTMEWGQKQKVAPRHKKA